MSRGLTAPPAGGNTSHPNIADVTNGYTFHAGGTVVAWKGGVNGTISGVGLTQSNTTGLTCTNQARFVTLGSSIVLSGDYSIMWRSKTTGPILNSLILSRAGTSTYLQMNTGLIADAIFFRDDSTFVSLDSDESLLTSLVDYCITVGATTKLYSKLATDTAWTLMDTAVRTGNAFTLDTILDGSFGQSNVGELHYLTLCNGKELTATDLLNFADPYTVSFPDIVGPVVGTCTIPIEGNFLEVPFTDETLPIVPFTIDGDGGFTISASWGAVTVMRVLRVSSNTYRLLPSRSFYEDEVVLLSYNGSLVTDSVTTPNALAAFSNRSVTNSSAVPAPPPPPPPPIGKLLVDYSDDWRLVDGVENAGFRFGPQRQHRSSTPLAPSSGMRVRRCNPTKADILAATALGISVESTDMVFTIWSETLADGATRITPERGDFVVVENDWRIVNLKRTIDYAQWRCLCRETAK